MAKGQRVPPQSYVPPKKASSRPKWNEGQATLPPVPTGNTLDEQMGHYPLLEAGNHMPWFAQDDLKQIIPWYVALDDAMVYVVCKLFTAKERGDRFGVDFDQQGNIRGAREGVGIPPTVTFQGKRYYLVYRKCYLLAGDHDLADRKRNLLSQRLGKKANSKKTSDFSFEAVEVSPLYMHHRHVLTWTDSQRIGKPAAPEMLVPPPRVPLQMIQYGDEPRKEPARTCSGAVR